MELQQLEHNPHCAADCQQCLLSRVHTALAAVELSEIEKWPMLQLTKQGLALSRLRPSAFLQCYHQLVGQINQLAKTDDGLDIYRVAKARANRLVAGKQQELARLLLESDAPLETGLHLVAAANGCEFGVREDGQLDLVAELSGVMKTCFERFDIEQLRIALESARHLLYLCDNCGEVVCDKLFIAQLTRLYPQLKTTVAVKSQPILNDATIKDAMAIGMDSVAELIATDSGAPGTVLTDTSPAFQALYRNADLIIAKGQGNAQTLLPSADNRLFLVLRVKCAPTAELTGTSKQSLVLMQAH